MYRRYFGLITVLLISYLSVNAEVGVVVGASAGLNLANLRKFTPPVTFNKKVVLGSDIAAVLRIDFNKYISLQTEVEFSQKGQRWKRTQDSALYNSKFVVNYVQFPILAVGRYGNEKVKGILQFGPYVSYWTGGFAQNSVSIDKQSKNATTTTYKFTANEMRVDVGIVAALGTDIKVGKGWIEIAAKYDAGFLSIYKKNTGLPKLYNSSFGLSVGYLYTIK